jgi:hypothetical protein
MGAACIRAREQGRSMARANHAAWSSAGRVGRRRCRSLVPSRADYRAGAALACIAAIHPGLHVRAKRLDAIATPAGQRGQQQQPNRHTQSLPLHHRTLSVKVGYFGDRTNFGIARVLRHRCRDASRHGGIPSHRSYPSNFSAYGADCRGLISLQKTAPFRHERACLAVFCGHVDARESAGLLVQSPRFFLRNASGEVMRTAKLPVREATQEIPSPLHSRAQDGAQAQANALARTSPSAPTLQPPCGSERPDFRTWRYGYPPFSGRMFGSGN